MLSGLCAAPPLSFNKPFTFTNGPTLLPTPSAQCLLRRTDVPPNMQASPADKPTSPPDNPTSPPDNPTSPPDNPTSPPDKPDLHEPAKPTITPCPGSSEWRWPQGKRNEWRKILESDDDEYLDFYNYWSRPDARSKFRNKFPYPLWLGEDLTISPAGKPILVTEAYDNMVRRLSYLREEDRMGGRIKGAVITGQPGIGASLTGTSPRTTTHWQIHSLGKTVFQQYLLAQLISTKEVVLLCDSNRILLFFYDGLYHRLTSSGFNFLPKPPSGKNHDIWTLIDTGDLKEPPITESLHIWPVQTSSPNPIRWSNWVKHNKAALVGLPQWEMDELKKGFVLA